MPMMSPMPAQSPTVRSGDQDRQKMSSAASVVMVIAVGLGVPQPGSHHVTWEDRSRRVHDTHFTATAQLFASHLDRGHCGATHRPKLSP